MNVKLIYPSDNIITNVDDSDTESGEMMCVPEITEIFVEEE